MVPPESATGNLYKTNPQLTLQINKNHSDMVKLTAGDDTLRIIADKLKNVCCAREIRSFKEQTRLDAGPLSHDDQPRQVFLPLRDRGVESGSIWVKSWNHSSILHTLHAPDRDHRLKQIDQRVGNTFDWAFDDDTIELAQWLLKGSGLFWVSGKPGSGKSTFMKYLFQDKRTTELLHASSVGAKLMVVSFFFHHRGNQVQKTFEGLLRSIISQILEQDQEGLLFPELYHILEAQFRLFAESNLRHSLKSDIRELLLEPEFEKPGLEEAKSQRQGKLVKVPEDNSYLHEIVNNHQQLTAGRCLGIELRQLLQSCTTTNQHHNLTISDDLKEMDVPKSSFPTIQAILKNHYGRLGQIQKDLENREWTREHLYDALRRLISQRKVKINLLLILDALDEYDGRPEFIASFLRDLENIELSSTHLRILFSSRPWKIFIEEFASTPGFQIHDHTRMDIEELCATRMPQDDMALKLLSPLVPEIVTRTRGVFIWVKLVMNELTTMLTVADDMRMPHLQEELAQCLDSLPDELDEFYRLIIERIPTSVRWDAYVILETISRSMELLSIQELLSVVRISRSQTVSEAQCQLEQHNFTDKPQTFWAHSRQYLETATGGLVEVIESRAGMAGVASLTSGVQLMHQSVQDFFHASDLKSIILGPARARLVLENGYSFLSKYSFTTARRSSKARGAGLEGRFAAFGSFARRAEQSTGCSQLKFFQTEPGQDFPPESIDDHLRGQSDYLEFGMFPGKTIQINSVIELAVVHGLRLCLDDALENDSQHIIRPPDSHRPDPIALVLICAGFNTKPGKDTRRERAIDAAEILVSKGLSASANMTGLHLRTRPTRIPATCSRTCVSTRQVWGKTPVHDQKLLGRLDATMRQERLEHPGV